MKVLCFGSLNLDYVYNVNHIVTPGETETSSGRNVFCGGKGLNQSIAMSRAGLDVCHAGMVGPEGDILLDALKDAGVDTSLVRRTKVPTGHTFIQVSRTGQNSIVLFGGANQEIDEEYIDSVLSEFAKGDAILLQNEINNLNLIIDKAWEKGMFVILNPSPCNERISLCDLGKVGLFIVNEVEGAQISGLPSGAPGKILDWFSASYPDAQVVLTLGEDGSWYMGADHARIFQRAVTVEAVDTTAAGDTFTGYFLEGLLNGRLAAESMERAAKASAIAVTRQGAAPSIPMRDELE